MRVKVEPNQTLFDVALQVYGTLDGVWKLLEDNTVLFDKTYYDNGVSIYEQNLTMGFTDISMPLVAGQVIEYDATWDGSDRILLKKLKGVVPTTAYALGGDAVSVLYLSPTGKRPAIAPPVLYETIPLNVVLGEVVEGLLTAESIIDMSEFGSVWNKSYYLGNPYGLEARWNFPFLHYNAANRFEWSVKELNYYYLQDMWRLPGAFNYCFAVLDYSGAVCNGLLELYIGNVPLTVYAPVMVEFIVRTDLVVTGTVSAQDYILCRSTTIAENGVLNVSNHSHIRLGAVLGTGKIQTKRSPLPVGNYDGFSGADLEYINFTSTDIEGIMGDCTNIGNLRVTGNGYKTVRFASNNIRVNNLEIYNVRLFPDYGTNIYISGNIYMSPIGSTALLLDGRTSTLHFVGRSTQKLTFDSGLPRIAFNDMVVDKAEGNVRIDNEVQVSGNIELVKGNITGIGTLIITGANSTITGNANAYITTAVRKVLVPDVSVFIPLGFKFDFMPMDIIFSGPLNNTVTVQGIPNNFSSVSPGISGVLKVAWSFVWSNTDPFEDTKIALHFPKNMMFDPTKIRVAHLVNDVWQPLLSSYRKFPDRVEARVYGQGTGIFTICEVL